jgi:large conductance mechanosensitive channel
MEIKTWKNFTEFLKEYKVLTIAVAFVMGTAVNDLVKSFVNNIFMPLLDPFIPDGTWETATLSIGSIKVGWGAFTASFLQFFILAFVIYMLVKKLLKKPQKEESKAVL